jgi:hypothetical protein
VRSAGRHRDGRLTAHGRRLLERAQQALDVLDLAGQEVAAAADAEYGRVCRRLHDRQCRSIRRYPWMIFATSVRDTLRHIEPDRLGAEHAAGAPLDHRQPGRVPHTGLAVISLRLWRGAWDGPLGLDTGVALRLALPHLQ